MPTCDRSGPLVLAMPHLMADRRERMTVAPGTTIAEMVAAALPGLTEGARSMVRVTVGAAAVPEDWWARVKPKPTSTVIIRVVPQGGSARTVLAIAVTIAASVIGAHFLAPAILGAFSIGATTFTGTLVTGLVAGATATAAGLLFNALVPLKPPAGAGGEQGSPTYSIQGFQNAANPNGVVPDVLGRHRFAPPYAVMPYTEIADDEQYVVAAFNFGYGPVAIENIRLGDAAISTFTDVTYEVRQGYDTDAPLTLITEQVIEESVDVEGENPPEDDEGNASGVESIRTTARNSTDVSVDFTFPEGLAEYDVDGDPQNLEVQIQIRQRLLGEDDFTTVTTLVIERAERNPVRVTQRWTLPAPGQYEIGVTRITDTFTDVSQRGRYFWSAIRSHRPGYPIAFPRPLALIAVRIKATGQVNGIVNNLNADVTRIAPDWDSGTQQWITRATRNPASLFRYVLQGNSNAYPKTDDQVALSDLAAWHEYCVAQGLRYDRVHDYEASLFEVLRDVAAAGRATPRDNGTQWTVAVDRPQTVVVGHITPRNSWGFQGERAYLQPPDAFRCTFRDRSNGYLPRERLILWPTFVGTEEDVELAEEIELPDITEPAQIFREARRRQYELIHRPDTYVVNQDMEALVLTRGDLSVLSHYVLSRVQQAARVKSVDGATVVLDTIVTIEAGTAYGIRFRLADGDTLVRPVISPASGDTQVLALSAGAMPAAGDLASFGPLGSESYECVVKGVEAADNLNFRLTLVDHAPQIEALVDGDELPSWTEYDPDEVSTGRPVGAGGGVSAFAGASGSGGATNYSIDAAGMGDPEDGDLIVVLLHTTNVESAPAITPPAGWTPLFSTTFNSGLNRASAYHIEYGTGSPHGNFSHAGGVWAHTVYRVRQWQGAPEAATATGSSSTADPPNLAPSWGSAETLWIAATAWGSHSTPPTIPASYQSRVDGKVSGSTVHMTSAHRAFEAASENPSTFGLPASGAWLAATIAVRPPA